LQFSDIVGLDEVKYKLIASVKNKHVAHAQLFSGSEGSANLALAIAFAQFINCEDKQEADSCGSCSSCIQYKKMAHPDLHLVFPLTSVEKIDKDDLKNHLTKQFRAFVRENPFATLHEWGQFIGSENKQFNIPVDEGREILRSVSLKAFQAEYKVVLIWLAEFMNVQTANAILKVLEEPPGKTLFFLVTNHSEKLLATILSRCQMLSIRTFNTDETASYLIKNKICELERATEVATIADGNLSKAIQIGKGEVDSSYAQFREWMKNCFSVSYEKKLIFTDDLAKIGRENQKSLLQYGMQIVREIMMIKSDAIALVKHDAEEKNFIINISKSVREDALEQFYLELNEAYHQIDRNGNAKLIFFDTSVRLSRFFIRERKN
jgi:DNA polymerase III subunit delta'